MADDQVDFELPPLREDLTLHEGPVSPTGSPTWSLHDPLRNQYFRVGWQEFEFLSRWRAGSAQALVDGVCSDTTLTVNLEQLQILLRFLTVNSLVVFPDEVAAEQLHNTFQMSQKGKVQKFLKSYLFFKIPIIQPDQFLERTLPYVKPLISKAFVFIIFFMACLALYLVGRQWESFTNTFMYFFNTSGMVYYAIAIFAIKVLHELGHGYVATYYGCRVPSMGVVFLVFWPVFYTDTTDAWRLTSRYQRMNIAAAGIVVEMIIAVLATILWVFLSDGPLRSTMFFVATVSWTVSLLINANPFLRFDGYYFFADWMNVSNLQTRAFANTRWQLRRWFFGVSEPIPYNLHEKTHNALVVYSLFTWVYRFFLMLGIATLLYFLFFKLLALVMVVIAVTMFVVGPIYNELKVYWEMRDQMKWNQNTKWTAGVLGGLLLVFILPWKTSVNVPALLEYNQHRLVYTQESGQLKLINIKNNQQVKQGELVIKMESPQLDFEISQLEKDIAILEYRLRKEMGKTEKLGISQTDDEELARKTAELMGLKEQRAKLNVTAQFDGEIRDLNKELKLDAWFSKNMLLFELINSSDSTITAYVPGSLVKSIKSAKTARFYPENYGESPIVKAKIITIDPVTTEVLSKPYLASHYEGDIAVFTEEQHSLVLQDAMYRVVLAPIDKNIPLNSVTRGTVQLAGTGRSLFMQAWRAVGGVLIRESGF